MRSGTFYNLHTGNKNKINRIRYIQGLFVAGVLLLSSSVKGSPILSLSYINGGTQYDTVCANEPADISSYLSVTDLSGSTVVWTAAYGSPYHGTVTGLPDTAIIPLAGSTANASGVMYMPAAGFSGHDGIIIMAKDNNGHTVYTNIHFVVNPQPSIVLGAQPSVCAGATSVSISYTGLTNIEADTFNYTTVGGGASFQVPAGVSSINFDVQGARGGADNATPFPVPGNGGRMQGALAVTAGERLHLFVGGEGGAGSNTGAAGGFNGGGATTFYVYGSGGGGGGASDIRIGGTGLGNRVVVAGGGGGSGYDGSTSKAGGAGGGLTGGNSEAGDGGQFGAGGTQTAGGLGATYTFWAPGMNGSSGTGGNGSIDGISGAGGGGYYGGGGGVWTGGGGGSSYADTTGGLVTTITDSPGYDTSNGQITLTYAIPGTYSIVWDSAAHSVGFRDTSSVPMSIADAGSFVIPIPSITDTTATLTYSGTLTVSTAICMSPGYAISVTVKPIPEVHIPGNQVYCNGDTTSDIFLNSSVAIDTIYWATISDSIGVLTTTGINKIAKFITTNLTTEPLVAVFTLTPTANGCSGTPETFTITDNPIPVLGSTTTPAPVCYGSSFFYPQNSTTAGTTYTWSRAATTGISNDDTSGSGNIDELLIDTTNSQVTVVYEDTLNFMGCVNVQSVTVLANPLPMLTSSLTPPAVCSGAPFTDTATTNVIGTLVTWSRMATAGISNGAASGSDSIINEILADTTNAPVTVTYTDTLNFQGCLYTQNIVATVNPLPMLTTPLIIGATCDTVSYTAMSSDTGTTTTFAWDRDSVAGISNMAGSNASATIYEGLTNTTPYPVVVIYTYTLTAYGCSSSQNVTDTIKPTPVLVNPTPEPDSICSNTVFMYSGTSATAGTTYSWSRAMTTGISNSPSSASSDSIAEILINTTAGTVPVTYIYTLTAASCKSTENVVIHIKPTPALSNAPIDTSVCDNTLFSYNPVSATGGASYAWVLHHVSGIDNLPASGTDGVSVTLDNTTYVNVLDTFIYTITANECIGTQDVIFTVNPNPVLSSDSTETVCSGSVLTYDPSSYTPTTTFAWTTVGATDITSSTDSGMGTITDTLTSSSSSAIDVIYVYTLTAYGCTNTQDITVMVNPAPAISQITTFAPNAACENTMYQNFGTSVAPPAGMEYTWVAENAQVYAMGANNQYCLVNFNNPGVATVYLLINNTATNCLSNAGYQVTVSSTENSSPAVIYVNGEFICQTTNVSNYQWGYDDATTLDSAMVAGETNQNYYNPNPDPTKYYWVMTTSSNGGCLQKSYYQVPPSNVTGVVNVNAGKDGVKIYPNPATESINVDIQSVAGGSFRIEVLNILGQSVNKVITTDHNAIIDVAGLPAGCYMVDCYNDGVKIATAKFIKN